MADTIDATDNTDNDEFTAAVTRALEIDAEISRLEAERRVEMGKLLALTGLKVGDTVRLSGTVNGVLNKVRANFEPVLGPDQDFWVLVAEGECSPLTKAGKPSAREIHQRYRKVYRDIRMPIAAAQTEDA